MQQMAGFNNHRYPYKRYRDTSYTAEEPSYERCQPDASSVPDAPDIFGRYVASKLRQMDKQNQMLSERLISEVLFRGQMGLLTRSSRLNDEEVNSTIKVED